jgi:multidrug resistance protein, MATE family
MKKVFDTHINYLELLRIAAPLSLSILIPQVNYFTNTVFLGRLGARELGVNGIAGVYYLILSMIGYGLANGVQIQLSRRAGEKDNITLAKILANSALLSLLVALVLMLVTMWLVPFLFGVSLKDYDNFELAVKYIYIRVWGLPFLLLTQLLNAFYVSIGKTRFFIYGSAVTTIVNIVFDYLLIFGKSGFPEMGFTGASLASVIAEIFYFLTMAAVFFYHKFYIEYPITEFFDFDRTVAAKSLKVSLPLIVQFIFSIGSWLLFFIFIEHLGKQALAASQVLRNVFGIIGIGTWALATTANTTVSRLIGEGRQKEIFGLIIKICTISVSYTAILCAALQLFSHSFLSIYTSDQELIQYAVPSLRIIMVAAMLIAVSTILFNSVVGTGNTVVNLTMEALAIAVYVVYCYYFIYVRQSPLYICWSSEFVYWGSLLIVSFLYLRSGKWKNKQI